MKREGLTLGHPAVKLQASPPRCGLSHTEKRGESSLTLSPGGVWTLLSLIGAGASWDAGAGWGVLPLLGASLPLLLIFILSLRERGVHPPTPLLLPLLVLAAILGWLIGGEPLLAVVCVVMADSLAAWPTLLKVWHRPDSEPPLLWLLGSGALLTGLPALHVHSLTTLLYPLYVVGLGFLVAGLSLARARVGLKPAP